MIVFLQEDNIRGSVKNCASLRAVRNPLATVFLSMGVCVKRQTFFPPFWLSISASFQHVFVLTMTFKMEIIFLMAATMATLYFFRNRSRFFPLFRQNCYWSKPENGV
jgi:hypothetical protein